MVNQVDIAFSGQIFDAHQVSALSVLVFDDFGIDMQIEFLKGDFLPKFALQCHREVYSGELWLMEGQPSGEVLVCLRGLLNTVVAHVV